MSRRAGRPRLSRRSFLALGTAAAGGLALGGCSRRRRDDRRPPIILLSLDTTRADRLGWHGYRRPTTPELDRVAADAVVYTRGVSPSSWTLPAHASLFTGKFAASHGARYDPQGPLRIASRIGGDASLERIRARGLGRDETTLARWLADAGYATGGVVGGPWLARVFGLDRGFEHWDERGITSLAGRRAGSVTDGALEWLAGLDGRPYFLFLNYYDPHGPYGAPAPFTHAFGDEAAARAHPEAPETRNDLYDGEVRYMDHEVGRLLGALRERGDYDGALVVVTSDHGELLGEHGMWGHGLFLSEPELHVPLAVKYPHGEVAPRTDRTRVQLVDVAPLILERLGYSIPDSMQGGAPPAVTHPVVAEVNPLPHLSPAGDWLALYEDDWKYAWNSGGNHLLFDLARDAGETRNLAATEPERARTMQARLAGYLAGLPAPGPAGPEGQLDEETRRALEGLGYIK